MSTRVKICFGLLLGWNACLSYLVYCLYLKATGTDPWWATVVAIVAVVLIAGLVLLGDRPDRTAGPQPAADPFPTRQSNTAWMDASADQTEHA